MPFHVETLPFRSAQGQGDERGVIHPPTRHSDQSEESPKQDTPCSEPRFFEQPLGGLPFLLGVLSLCVRMVIERSLEKSDYLSTDSFILWRRAECAAARRAIGTRKGEQLT